MEYLSLVYMLWILQHIQQCLVYLSELNFCISLDKLMPTKTILQLKTILQWKFQSDCLSHWFLLQANSNQIKITVNLIFCQFDTGTFSTNTTQLNCNLRLIVEANILRHFNSDCIIHYSSVDFSTTIVQ